MVELVVVVILLESSLIMLAVFHEVVVLDLLKDTGFDILAPTVDDPDDEDEDVVDTDC